MIHRCGVLGKILAIKPGGGPWSPAGLGILISILGLWVKDDWDFRTSDLLINPDGTDI